MPKQYPGHAVQILRNDYTVTPVTTAAYVELDAALNEFSAEIEIFDSSTRTLVLALGAAGSERDEFFIIPGGNGRIIAILPKGARLAIKAVSGDATTGELIINLWG